MTYIWFGLIYMWAETEARQKLLKFWAHFIWHKCQGFRGSGGTGGQGFSSWNQVIYWRHNYTHTKIGTLVCPNTKICILESVHGEQPAMPGNIRVELTQLQLWQDSHSSEHSLMMIDIMWQWMTSHKYTNNEANKAFDDSRATLMQKWAWQKSAEAEQFFRWKRLCIDVELLLKIITPLSLLLTPFIKCRLINDG